MMTSGRITGETKMLKVKNAISIIVIAAIIVAGFVMPTAPPAFAASRVKVPTPKNVKVTAIKAKQLKVTWKKVSGASGYIIYMAKKNMTTGRIGKYKKVKTIKKSSTVSYTKKKLRAGTKYYFKIKAYKGNVKSRYTKVKSAYARRAGPAITKAAPLSNQGAVFGFKAAKGAIEYYVQTKTGKRGKWEDNASFGGRMANPKISISLRGKEGKTVYVRMGVLTKIGKVTLASVWGKAKAVNIPKKSKYKTEYDDPNFYMDNPVVYKKGGLPLDGQFWDGAIGKYLSMG
jgi:hypothetical protein